MDPTTQVRHSWSLFIYSVPRIRGYRVDAIDLTAGRAYSTRTWTRRGARRAALRLMMQGEAQHG